LKNFRRFLLLLLILGLLIPDLAWSKGGGHSYSSRHSYSKSGKHYTSRYKSSYGYGTGSSSHSEYVHGYTKKNGTHVDGYHRTVGNGTQKDNYSAKGNVNPWTGKVGTKNADK
jgi:hypothetical protein